MCGVAFTFNIEETLARECVNEIRVRGKDNFGKSYTTDGGCLYHSRLSILDLSAIANQPMTSSDGQWIVVFNGEIYNYLELKRTYKIKTNSTGDTEVLVELLAQQGLRIVKELEGPFAFIAYNIEKKIYYFGRDRFGEKPMYLWRQNDKLLISSSLKSFAHLNLDLNRNWIREFISTDFSTDLSTIYSGVYAVDPGELFSCDLIEITSVEEYKIGKSLGLTRRGSLKDVIESSVTHQITADVPVCLFLSGGLDSTIIASILSKKGMADNLKAFSIGFEGKFDESGLAELSASELGLSFEKIIITPDIVLSLLPDFLNSMDNPTVDGLNVWIISKFTSEKGYKVALSGLGGDEMFAGYKVFKRFSLIRRLKFIFNFIRILAKTFLRQSPSKFCYTGTGLNFRTWCYFMLRSSMNREFLGVDINKDISTKDIGLSYTYSEWSLLELSHYTSKVLMNDSDTFGMSNGQEIRMPFINIDILNTVLPIKDYVKTGRVNKSLLFNLFEDDLPKSFDPKRPKSGFSFPWAEWLRGPLKQEVSVTLKRLIDRDLLSSSFIEDQISWLGKNDESNWTNTWKLYVLEKWIQTNCDMLKK